LKFPKSFYLFIFSIIIFISQFLFFFYIYETVRNSWDNRIPISKENSFLKKYFELSGSVFLDDNSFTCSTFLINKNTAITAAHCVINNDTLLLRKLNVSFNINNHLYSHIPVKIIKDENLNKYRKNLSLENNILHFNNDYAILKLMQDIPEKIPFIYIPNKEDYKNIITTNTKYVSLSIDTFTDDLIRSFEYFKDKPFLDDVLNKRNYWYQFDVAVSPGMSGGAVLAILNKKIYYIGIITGSHITSDRNNIKDIDNIMIITNTSGVKDALSKL